MNAVKPDNEQTSFFAFAALLSSPYVSFPPGMKRRLAL
jgi:hypothetical protein